MEIEPNEIALEAQAEAAPEIELQDAESKRSERRIFTPEREPATRQNVEDEGQDPYPKARRVSEEVIDTSVDNGDALTAMGGDIDTLSADVIQ